MTDEQNVDPQETTEVPQPEQHVDLDFDEVVDQVIRGEWGASSAIRRQRLSEAGYDHVAVLKAVVRKGNHLS